MAGVLVNSTVSVSVSTLRMAAVTSYTHCQPDITLSAIPPRSVVVLCVHCVHNKEASRYFYNNFGKFKATFIIFVRQVRYTIRTSTVNPTYSTSYVPGGVDLMNDIL